jgi:4-diphosphocytidyl-2-C-methyl-D-erythritol kinase
MVIFPKSKINIGLRIAGSRPDGYHDIQTIFYPVPFCDALEFVVPAQSPEDDVLEVTGLPPSCSNKDNLVIKAVKQLRSRSGFPFLKIHLHKAIPTGAGLGGGSSDAASFMKSLNRHFDLAISQNELKEISLSLGSDCPFFVDGIPVYAEGRGEIMTPVKPLAVGFQLILVKPVINIDTKEAYKECIPSKTDSNIRELYDRDIHEWKQLIVNDFEKSIFKKFPEIAEIKESLYKLGAIYSSLSGSGSSVYGIFAERPDIPLLLRKRVIYSGAL